MNLRIFWSLFLFLSFNVLAVDKILLDNDSIYLPTSQRAGEALCKITEITRTKDSPRKVSIAVPFDYRDTYCTHYRFSTIGRYSSYMCDSFASRIATVEQTFVLEFKDAKYLAESDQEIFKIILTQKSFNSDHVKIDGYSLSKNGEYKIRHRHGHRNDGLKFKYKD